MNQGNLKRKEENLKDNNDNLISSQKIEEEHGMDELNKGSFVNELIDTIKKQIKTIPLIIWINQKLLIQWLEERRWR